MDITLHTSFTHLNETEWASIADPDFPFSAYHFLRALQDSDCLGDRTGWYPKILLARAAGRLCGALVGFEKTNSYGEYIFDFAWANAYHAHGLKYYPKLTAAVPFTPATGPKLLVDRSLSPSQRHQVREALIGAFSRVGHVSSRHALFLNEIDARAFTSAGYLLRESYQFHWENEDYAAFPDFLSRLRGKRRREIVRERARVADLSISRLTGAELTQERADEFYTFYLSTIDKKEGLAYLTLKFFRQVFATMSDNILLVLARDTSGNPIAGALNYFGPSTLYGRHWGARCEVPALHFELCYYQGIEFAIERGLKRFEAGAQGEHKLQRGFEPRRTWSAHQIRDPRFAAAIEQFIAEERAQIAEDFSVYAAHSPFGQR